MTMSTFLCLLAACLSPQEDAQASSAERAAPWKIQVTRQDLAEVVEEIDRAFTEGRRLPATEGRSALAETNLAFDAITSTFFSLNLVGAFEELVTMRNGLLGPDAEAFPSTVIESEVMGTWVRYACRWEGAPDAPTRLRRRHPALMPMPLLEDEPTIVMGGAPLHAALNERLKALEADVQPAAARVMKKRLGLPWYAPSQALTREFLVNPVTYEASLLAEMAALEKGENPYALRRGDHWRTFAHGRRNLSARVFCPNASPASGMPLIVALHGAGGDENFLFEIAGQGHIKALCERHKALVVAPFTVDFMSSKKAFESLLAGIKLDYDFDEERVFLVGHSMGAMAAAKLCHEVPERLAGAACIAGFTANEFEADLPIHVLSGELDTIVPFRVVKANAERAAEAGAQIRLTPMKDQGHTLLLPAALDLVFEGWFGPK